MDSADTERPRWYPLWQYKGTVLGLAAVCLALVAGLTQAPTESLVYIDQVWGLEEWYSLTGYFGVLTLLMLAFEWRERRSSTP